MKYMISVLALSGLLAACNQAPAPSARAASTSATEPPAQSVTVKADFPASVAAFGDGYPKSGDPCRRLGESAATADFLDDSAVLVGCPSAEAAAALPGKQIGVVEGISLVSVPMGDANPGLGEAVPADNPQPAAQR
jgi:hypothetical protein